MNVSNIDPTTGEYVDTVPYLEMRLRMVLTGSAQMPDDATWAKELKRLLAHLREHPMKAERKPALAACAAPISWDEMQHALSAVRDLAAWDWTSLVMGSDHPIAARFENARIMGVSLGANRMERLIVHDARRFGFALDVDVAFESGSLNLTVMGTRNGDEYRWHWADPTLADAKARETALDNAVTAIPDHPLEIGRLLDGGVSAAIDLRVMETGIADAENPPKLAIETDVGCVAITGTAKDAFCVIRARITLGAEIAVPAVLCVRVADADTDEPKAFASTIYAF